MGGRGGMTLRKYRSLSCYFLDVFFLFLVFDSVSNRPCLILPWDECRWLLCSLLALQLPLLMLMSLWWLFVMHYLRNSISCGASCGNNRSRNGIDISCGNGVLFLRKFFVVFRVLKIIKQQ